MARHDDLQTQVIHGALFGGVVALYGWLFRIKTRAFRQARTRLSDRIDRSSRL